MSTHLTNRFWLISLTVAGALGCRPDAATPPAPHAARQELTNALEHWRAGDPPSHLASEFEIHIADEDWERGWKLNGFSIADDGQPRGTGMLIGAHLELTSPQSRTMEKDVQYIISEGDVLSIVRTDD